MEAHVILENINRPLTKEEQYELAVQLADAASELGLRFSNTAYTERGL